MTDPSTIKVIVETMIVEREDGFWIDVHVDRVPYDALGPFETQDQARRAQADLSEMNRQHGAVDMPVREQ